MALHPEAGKIATPKDLINVPAVVRDYYVLKPDLSDAAQCVKFGTSGHRGRASSGSFNDSHIAAICQALAEYRASQGITGPLYIGKDTHALSEPALATAVEVLAANKVKVILQDGNNESGGYTPTPVISRTIVRYNEAHADKADGIVITPSHNPPEDGGFKYNPPHGGPAGSEVTKQIEQRANELLKAKCEGIKRLPYAQAMQSDAIVIDDFMLPYIKELDQVIDMQAIANAKLKLGTDPLGGAGLGYWPVIAREWGLDITVVNESWDPRFAFMHRDKDGRIRMDCSSASAMAGLISLQESFDLAFGNDPDFDRHGIVCRGSGLMNPNHYLAVAVEYLYTHRSQWHDSLKVGKTLVSSSMLDRVAGSIDRDITEMPVGFKWFVDGLCEKTIGFAGEESAGGIFLQRGGSTWATDKDGFIMCLLAAEILAVTGQDPAQHYDRLTQQHSTAYYRRVDVPTTHEKQTILSAMDASVVNADALAGESVESVITHASGNNAAIGGLKVTTANGWFAARPSGTELVYKIYAESFKSESHLEALLTEAQALVESVLG